jgi:hypothetical protein
MTHAAPDRLACQRSTPATDATPAMPPAHPSPAPTATPIIAMPMPRGWSPLDIFNQPIRGVCEASVDRHRLRCTERQRKANTNHGCAAQNSAHHRPTVELVHLRRSPDIELAVQQPTAREARATSQKSVNDRLVSRRELRSRASAPACAECGACGGLRP